MIHNYSWLKTSFCNDLAQNYSQLSIGLDHAPESEVSLSFENFVAISNFLIFQSSMKIWGSIAFNCKNFLDETCLSLLPFDLRKRQIATRSNWFKVHDYIQNEREALPMFYHNVFGYSGKEFHSRISNENEKFLQDCIKKSEEFETEIISRNCPENFQIIIKTK